MVHSLYIGDSFRRRNQEIQKRISQINISKYSEGGFSLIFLCQDCVVLGSNEGIIDIKEFLNASFELWKFFSTWHKKCSNEKDGDLLLVHWNNDCMQQLLTIKYIFCKASLQTKKLGSKLLENICFLECSNIFLGINSCPFFYLSSGS